MTNTKNTKRALLSSVMALFLCFAMLLGTTYAWFTDSVTSSGNIIKSGTLDVELYYADGKQDPASVTWEDASAKAIFDYDNWEPGYTDAKHIKVANEGTLDLQWQLSIVPNGNVSDLAKVIDVYYVTSATAVAERTDVDAAWYVGTLADVINTGIADGQLTVSNPEYTATIVLKMQENAGNEYQNLSIGDSFSVVLFATQLSSESDSFNNEYDKNAAWDGTIPAEKPDYLVVDTTNKLISINDIQAFVYLNTLINDANFYENYGSKWQYTIELNTDVDLMNRAWTPIMMSNFVAFNGNGHTIRNLRVSSGGDNVGLFGSITCNDLGYCTVKDLTIDGAYVMGGNKVGVLVGLGLCTAENVTVKNATVNANKYVGGLAGRIGSLKNCIVENSTVVASDKTVGGLAGYCIGDPSAVVATGNTVENVTVTGAWNVGGMLGQAQNATVESNTVKNVTVVSTKALPADADDNEVRTAAVAARSAFDNTTIGANTVENVECGIEVYGLTLIPNGENSQIIVSDKEGFLNLTKLFADWTEQFTDGNGETVTNFVNGAGADYYYAGRWTVSLEADIDLNNATIDPVTITFPISTGALTFEGNGHTIKNAKIVTDATTQNAAGLFNFVCHTAVRDLKLDNIHVTGSNVGNSTAGVLAGSCNAGVSNITITNSSVTGGKYTGGVVGYGYTDVLNCTLTNVTVKGGYKLGGLIGYICASSGTGDVTGNTLTDCTVDGIGGGVYAGGKDKYIIGKLVGNYNCDGTCNNNTITNMTTSATENIGEIEAGKTVNQ